MRTIPNGDGSVRPAVPRTVNALVGLGSAGAEKDT